MPGPAGSTARLDPRDPATVALIVRAQLGERGALDAVLRGMQGPLYGHITLLLRDPESAKDVLQRVLMTVCRSLPGLRDPRLLWPWAYRVATRQAFRAARRTRIDALTDEVDADQVPTDDDEPLFAPELIHGLPGLVADLPPACGVAVRLHYLEDLSLQEIAEALEIPLGTVKSRLFRGIAALRARVAEHPPL